MYNARVAEYIGISSDAAWNALSRYHWQGLLHRKKGVYTINENGLQRISYLRSEETADVS